MSSSRKWTKIVEQSAAIPFWSAGAISLQSGDGQLCPSCKFEKLRVYAHHFDASRSAAWVWCPKCRIWTVVSNIRLELIIDDPLINLSPEEFSRLERKDWIDRLDGMYTTGQLPQKVGS